MPIIPVKTYYLEMIINPNFNLPQFPQSTTIEEWLPTAHEYLQIYNAVGSPWGWTGRTTIDTQELSNILNSNTTQLYILKYDNIKAGFAELHIQEKEVELKYFGLKQEFVGKGLGSFFLKWSIVKAWNFNPKSVSVHTCEFDHDSALEIYRRHGFELIKEQIDQEFYSDEFLKSR